MPISQRQSNLELLRIVAMLAVVGVHLDGASLGLPLDSQPDYDNRDIWRLIVEALTIVGVNCFTLISGFFGIKASWHSFSRFTGQCLFYSVAIVSIVMIIDGIWQWNQWATAWLIFTHSDLWYVPAYLGLWLLSPFLNAGAELLSKKQLLCFVAAFASFNIYAGWLNNGHFNPTGYTILHLIMMYLIGRYIGKHINMQSRYRKAVCLIATIIYLITTAVIAYMATIIPSRLAFAYNSPAVVVASVALFVAFASLHFHSKVINRLAASAFAVYLIHKNPYIWVRLIKPTALNAWQNMDLWQFSAMFVVACICIYVFAALIDSLRCSLFKLFTNKLKKQAK